MEVRLQVWLRNHNRLKKGMSASATVSTVEGVDDSNDVSDEQDNDDGENWSVQLVNCVYDLICVRVRTCALQQSTWWQSKQDLLVDMFFFAMGYDDVLIDAQLVLFENV